MMRLSAHNLVGALLFFLLSFFFVDSADALTSSFRSASVITTDGSPQFTNLGNCSITDGNTCDRAFAPVYASIYFKGFGSYAEFGIPPDSTVTKARVKVTGKTITSLYVGMSWGSTWNAICQSPLYFGVTSQLYGPTITSQTFTANVVKEKNVDGTLYSYCLHNNFGNDSFMFRINYSGATYWSANIDNFEVAFDYTPPATPTPTPAPTPSPTPTPTPTPSPTPTPTPTPILKTPLILIPGIMGSELKTAEEISWIEDDGHGFIFTHIYPKDDKVWVENSKVIWSINDDYFDILRMNKTGEISMAKLDLTGELANLYQDTIKFFTSIGYELNKDFFLFPYDWRKDISSTLTPLNDLINAIKTQTGSDKVDILAHSMGGLVARNYISDAERAKNVGKLFTLGTPHLGSVDFLKNLRYGGCLTDKHLENLPLCVGLTNSEVKDIVQNMISAYELAPTRKYFDFYSGEDIDHSYPYNDAMDIDGNGTTGALNYSQTKDLLKNLDHNATLFSPAEAFHTLDENLINTNGVKVYNIAGSGLPTVGQIIERYKTNLFGDKVSQKDEVFINGDETVPLMSASLIDYGKSLSLLGDHAQVYYTKQEHGNLVASGSALLLVKNILNDDNSLPDGVKMTPYNFSGYIVSGHSPINLDIYDSSGNHTGLTNSGDIEQNIPGSFYNTLDDAKFVYLPDDGTYSIKIKAIDQGSFDLKIRKYEDNINTATTLYANVPLTSDTKAETAFDTYSNTPPILELDENGDGTFEQDIYYEGASTPTPTSTSTPTPTPTSSTSSDSSSGSSSSSSSSENTVNQADSTSVPNPAFFLNLNNSSVKNEEIVPDIREVAGANTFKPIINDGNNNNKNIGRLLMTGLVLSGGSIIIIKLLKSSRFGIKVFKNIKILIKSQSKKE